MSASREPRGQTCVPHWKRAERELAVLICKVRAAGEPRWSLQYDDRDTRLAPKPGVADRTVTALEPHDTHGDGASPFGLAVFLSAATLLLLLGLGLGAFLPDDPVEPPAGVLAQFIDYGLVDEDGLRPEPKERTIFALLALAAPILVLACGRVLRRRPIPRVLLLAWLPLGLAAFGLLLEATEATLSHMSDALEPVAAWELLALGCAVTVAATRGWSGRLRAVGPGAALSVVVIVMVALKRHGLEHLTDVGVDDQHLGAFLYAIAQSAAGKLCLVDYVPQYGCYGQLLAPWVRLLGSTLTAVSTMMIAFCAAGALGIAVWLRAVVKTPALVTLGLACVSLLWIGQATKVPLGLHEPYFQYLPLRFVCPALALALGTLWRGPSVRLAAAFGAFSAIAVLFSPDSGVAVTGSLLAVVGFDALPRALDAQYRARLIATLRAMLAFCAGLGLGLLAFWLRTRALSGRWPDIAALFRYAEIFYLSGFNMLPMPREPAAWHVVAAVFLGLLVVGLVMRERDAGARPVLQLGVLGVGLFAYYTGRSHDAVLGAVSWPAVLGAVALLARVPRLPRRGVLGGAMRALTAGALAVALALCVVLAQRLLARSIPRVASAQASILEQIDFVERTSTRSQPIAVFAKHQAVILLQTHRASALDGPGLSELILDVDRRRMFAQLAAGRAELVYVDRELVRSRSILEPLKALLAERFLKVASSTDRRLTLYRRRSRR